MQRRGEIGRKGIQRKQNHNTERLKNKPTERERKKERDRANPQRNIKQKERVCEEGGRQGGRNISEHADREKEGRKAQAQHEVLTTQKFSSKKEVVVSGLNESQQEDVHHTAK